MTITVITPGIIPPGGLINQLYECKCWKCSTIFTYQLEDIKHDILCGCVQSCVQCPLCYSFIDHSSLQCK